MKAITLAYGGILLMLIIASLVAATIVSKSEPIERNVVTVEGKIISFTNEANLLVKTFDSSIEFIAQRAAYDLGSSSGIDRSGTTFWDVAQPSLSTLESELAKKIDENLPTYIKEDTKLIEWGEGSIEISNYDDATCGSEMENSKCFFVTGNKTLLFYDSSIESKVFYNPYKLDNKVASNYFKLIKAGRTLMEDSRFNTKFNDMGALAIAISTAKESGDPVFKDLDVNIEQIDASTFEITIEEKCYPPNTYCLAPLKPGENGELSGIPYDYLKLKFKINGAMGATEFVFDFNVKIDSNSGSVVQGNYIQKYVNVNLLGSPSKQVDLSYTIAPYRPSISVSFTPSSEKPTYPSVMKIQTTSSTPAGNYLIRVIGSGGGISEGADFTLTVSSATPPTPFTYSLSLNPLSDTANQGTPFGKVVAITITKTGGTSQQVSVAATGSITNGAVSYSFIPCTPNPTCSGTLTVSTSAATPALTYPITVTATSAGSPSSPATATYRLTVNPVPFTFSTSLNTTSGTATQGSAFRSAIKITVTKTSAVPSKLVSFSVSDSIPGITLPSNPTSCTPSDTSPYQCSSIYVISGTPSTSGTYTLSFSGTSGTYTSSPSTYRLTVNSPPPTTGDLEVHSFAGSIEILSVPVALRLGDVNWDGMVNSTDSSLIVLCFGSEPGDSNWDVDCDMRIDNIIDNFDSIIVSSNFNQPVPINRTPFKMSLAPGLYKLRAKYNNQVKNNESVTIVLGQTTKVNFTFP